MKKEYTEYKLTRETLQRLEECFSLGMSVKDSCYTVQISCETYYQWIKKYPELEARFKSFQMKPLLKAHRTQQRHLDNPKYATAYIKRVRPYVEDIEAQHMEPEKPKEPVESPFKEFIGS